MPVPSLFELGDAGLDALIRDLGEPAYRGAQIRHWLFRACAPSIDAMTDLPAMLRRRLEARSAFHTIAPVAFTRSADGFTDKTLFRLADGELIETVVMHYVDPADDAAGDASALGDGTTGQSAAAHGRHTVCLSTQAGCAMGCIFCATGRMGLARDLTAGECIEQVAWIARRLSDVGQRLTNVVLMGMGEPLANWPATWAVLSALCDPRRFAFSARRVTVSTVGIVPGILRLAECGLPVRLAVSLHAPDDALRDRLVGVNRTWPLGSVLDACRRFADAGGRRITFEYVLIDGVNDRPAQAARLAARLAGMRCHVNLIPLNPVAGSPLRPSCAVGVERFRRELERAGIASTSRLRRGLDIAAGCGQLRTSHAGRIRGRTLRPLAPLIEEDIAP